MRSIIFILIFNYLFKNSPIYIGTNLQYTHLEPGGLHHYRLVLKCGLAHLNANANAGDESNQMHLDQMQMLFDNYVFCVQQVIFC